MHFVCKCWLTKSFRKINVLSNVSNCNKCSSTALSPYWFTFSQRIFTFFGGLISLELGCVLTLMFWLFHKRLATTTDRNFQNNLTTTDTTEYLKHSALLKNTTSFSKWLGHCIFYTGFDYRSANLRYLKCKWGNCRTQRIFLFL